MIGAQDGTPKRECFLGGQLVKAQALEDVKISCYDLIGASTGPPKTHPKTWTRIHFFEEPFQLIASFFDHIHFFEDPLEPRSNKLDVVFC
jgi:hypothetical protein